MPTVRHVHSSGRQDRSPESLARVVRGYTGPDDDWNVLTFTEVGKPKRAAALKAPGWDAYTPDAQTDTAVMWDASVFKKVHTEVHTLTPKTFTDVSKIERHFRACCVVLDVGSSRFVQVVTHTPSGVQAGNKFGNEHPDKVRVWKAALEGLSDYARQCRKRFEPDLLAVTADWNVDFHREYWRRYVGNQMDGLRLTWTGDMPKGGTHGKRLIDGTWATRDGRARLLADDASSDHRPYGETINF